MTREDFRKIRETLGLSTERFGRALGYQGTHGTAARHIRRESGARTLPPWIERLLPPCMDAMASPKIGARGLHLLLGARANRIKPCGLSIVVKPR
jgi:hypothetical protein